MTVSFARVRTKHAGQYLNRLANDGRWNSLSVIQDDFHALVPLPFGTCEFAAADGVLDITITAPSLSDATLLEDAISERLDGFTSSEELQYHWIIGPPVE